jgi:hypothetical protein
MTAIFTALRDAMCAILRDKDVDCVNITEPDDNGHVLRIDGRYRLFCSWTEIASMCLSNEKGIVEYNTWPGRRVLAADRIMHNNSMASEMFYYMVDNGLIRPRILLK